MFLRWLFNFFMVLMEDNNNHEVSIIENGGSIKDKTTAMLCAVGQMQVANMEHTTSELSQTRTALEDVIQSSVGAAANAVVRQVHESRAVVRVGVNAAVSVVRDDIHNSAADVKDAVDGASAKVVGEVRDVKDAVDGVVGEVKDASTQVVDQVKNATDDVKRELQDMKEQMSELTNIVQKLSVKQGETSSRQPRPNCSICLRATETPYVLVPCGHCIFCARCVDKMKNSKDNSCPVCRKSIEGKYRIYFNADGRDDDAEDSS